MNITKLLKNPLIKITATIIILYFALFSNKSDPRSLANRLSSKKIKESISDASKQKDFIAKNLQKAKELQNKQILKNE